MTSLTSWYPAPEQLELEGEEVHVWRFTLDHAPPVVKRLFDILTTDEQKRADRFHHARDRQRFIIARGMLRTVLGYYLKIEPARLRFCYNRFGKPALTAASGGKELRFNVSRSSGIALFAFSPARGLGIDVELLREDFDWRVIAEQFFSQRELAILNALTAETQTRAFFNCWTRKEAYLKARGRGLSLPLQQFSVSVAPDEPTELLETGDDAEAASRWSLEEIIPGVGYVAALAVEGRNYHVTHWEWPYGIYGITA